MCDDAGVALLAHIDAIHLDDALSRVKTGDGCHRALCERRQQIKDKEVPHIIKHRCMLKQDNTSVT